MVNCFGQDFQVSSVSDPEIGSFTAADFNGDGFVDIIAIEFELNSAASIHLYTNKKENTISFTGKELYNKIPFSGRPTSGDMDGDGDVDVVYNNSSDNTLTLLQNDGTGTFTQTPLGVPGSTRLFVTDLDKDGDLDMVGTRKNPNFLHIYINNGNLTFTATNIYSGTIGPEAFDVSDFDKDGDLDILVGINDRFNTQVFIYQNNGNGTYTVNGIPTSGFGSLSNIYAADINNDGNTDILVLTNEDVKILVNKGTLTFEEKKLQTGDARLFTGARVVDLTGEGHPDIVVGSLDGMQWYKNISLTDLTYEQGVMNDVTGAFYIASADLNNDNANDVITSNSSLWLYQNKIVQLPSGSDDLGFENTLIYPNPVTDEISFRDLNGEGYTVTIYNTTGQAVLQSTVIGGKTNVATLHPGIYKITLHDANGNPAGRQKVIKL
jgi:hypothetical protein